MASSVDTGVTSSKPSFARVSYRDCSNARHSHSNEFQIAAAGIQPSSGPTNSQNRSNSIHRPSSTSPSPAGSNNSPLSPIPRPLNSKAQQAQLAHLDQRNLHETVRSTDSGPEVLVQAADRASPPTKTNNTPDGLLLRTNTDEVGTLLSSSDGDGKPPSLDGKSVASGTTFALDEKESLRPDDSASVQASAEDEDLSFPPGAGVPTSRMGSEDGVRAFRDQLHEIHAMDPSRRPQVGTGPGANNQGVLYVPPEGPGMGSVPRPSRQATLTAETGGTAPDTKLLEALENPRDRIWVLKLEQDVIDFVKDAKESSLNLPQCNSFYRMLAHKIADYYMLGHSVDDSNSAVRLFRTPHCRVPQPLTGVVTPSTAASTPPPSGPQIKLLRRGIDPGPAIANGSNINSKTNSDDDSGDDKKRPVTREEREARYEAARLRIMGSAKPIENEAYTKEKDESRSSSAAGKKSKKKQQQRDNSDDGFEARSAYSSYFAPTYSSTGYTSQPVAFQNPQSSGATQYSPSPYVTPDMNALSQYGGVPNSGAPWGASPYPTSDGSQPWYQGSQPYDLSKNFTQAMSFQGPHIADQQQASPGPYAQGFPQQSLGLSGGWQQQSIGSTQQPSTGFGHPQNFPDRGSMPTYTSQQQQQAQLHQQQQNYAFGQLPSQNLGRAPSALEHPLPGSWKSPHFNPQSQTFVPGPTNSGSFGQFAPQRQAAVTTNTIPQGMPYPLERQMSSQSQGSSYGAPHGMSGTSGSRMPAQPLTHPLPQPVFPRQPSPNVPLPPKPMTGHQMQMEQARQSPSSAHQLSPQNSSIAKWGAPASLPAKPPPSNEPFDSSRFNPAQRTPSFNVAAAARLPGSGMSGGGLSGFGPMQSVNGGPMANGNGSPARSR